MADNLKDLLPESFRDVEGIEDSRGLPFAVDNLRYNNMFRRGNKKEMDLVWDFLRKHNRMPSEEEFKTLGGGGGFHNIQKDMGHILRVAGVDPLKYQSGSADPDSHTLMSEAMDINREGSKINEMFNMFKAAGDIQYEQGVQNSQKAERDLAMNQGMDRQKFLDEIRNRRRTLLKTGLSSAQIANQEVQSMMMSQGQSNMNAMDFFGQRQQMEQQHAMNPFNAYNAAHEMMGPNAFGGTMGTILAGSAGSGHESAINYSKGTGTDYASSYKKIMESNTK